MCQNRTFGNQSEVTVVEPTPTSPLDLKPTEDGLLSLNALWAVAKERGFAKGKHDPRQWKVKAGNSYIEAVAEKSNVSSGNIWKSKRGNGGGTYAHPLIALKPTGISRLEQFRLLEVTRRHQTSGYGLIAKATYLSMFRSEFGRGWER